MLAGFDSAAAVIKDTMSLYPEVARAYIFGSYAANQATEDSDLDIIVELDDNIGLKFIDLINKVEELTGVEVDMITIEQAQSLEEKYGYEILNIARTVYEKKQH